jgi:hypothetical protein
LTTVKLTIRNDDTLHTPLDSLLRIVYCLNTLQNDRPIPVLLQELQVFPSMRDGWEYFLRPRHGCQVEIFLDLFTSLSFMLCPEYWIAEPNLYSNLIGLVKSRAINDGRRKYLRIEAMLHIVRPPTKAAFNVSESNDMLLHTYEAWAYM